MIPHVSSMFFYQELLNEIESRKIDLGENKWFTNLTWVGNMGSASIFVALDEFLKTQNIPKGKKILLLVPESGRFSYGNYFNINGIAVHSFKIYNFVSKNYDIHNNFLLSL